MKLMKVSINKWIKRNAHTCICSCSMCTHKHTEYTVRKKEGTRILKYTSMLLIIIVTILYSRLEKVLPAEIYFLTTFPFLIFSYHDPNNNYSVSVSLNSTRSSYTSFLNTDIFSKSNPKFCLKAITH